MKCSNCKITLLSNARFCHGCGEKTKGSPVKCPSCESENARGAKFCMQCGCALSVRLDSSVDKKYTVSYPLNFAKIGQLSDQISGHFFTHLKKRIVAEHPSRTYNEYVTAFYDSSFDKRFAIKATQLAEETYTIHCRQDSTILQETDRLLERSFDSLIDHFIIMHCKDLNEVNIPESILKYNGKTKNEINVEEMIFDYLDLDNEKKEKFYLDFIAVPQSKIKTAAQSFLFADKKEMVYLLCDQTVFGSCKEGFAITERGIYWKAHFNKAFAVHYENLQEIKREKDWININDRYFHVNPSFDFKMMKLLQKMKEIY
ncbi:MAG: hypothetical protein ACI94Y_000302 [Maribacter sp.]|jgi:hypothetical protein